jgi:hypothetical protein
MILSFPCFYSNHVDYRPITSYGALDLPTYFLDLTPFAPVFADGLPHEVTLDVVSAEANHTLNQNWYVSGLLQVVTDPSGKPTTGKITAYDVQPYAVTETTASISGTDVNVTVKAQRTVKIESTVVSGSGMTNNVIFQQNLDYTNTQYYLNNAYIQVGTHLSPIIYSLLNAITSERCADILRLSRFHSQRSPGRH